jgi:hypothetical protein
MPQRRRTCSQKSPRSWPGSSGLRPRPRRAWATGRRARPPPRRRAGPRSRHLASSLPRSRLSACRYRGRNTATYSRRACSVTAPPFRCWHGHAGFEAPSSLSVTLVMLIRLTPHHTTGGRWSAPGGHRGPAAFERLLELSQRAGEVRPGHGRHTTDWGVWSQPDKHDTCFEGDRALDHHPTAAQDTWGQRAIAMPTLTFAPSKRSSRSAAGFTGEPGPSSGARAQGEVALVVPMRFEVFWTVPGGRSVGTQAFDLEGRAGAPRHPDARGDRGRQST